MVQFADRMDLLKGSAIRELLALANKPEIISFAGGMTLLVGAGFSAVGSVIAVAAIVPTLTAKKG